MEMRFQAIALLVLFMSQKAWTCQHGDIRFHYQGDLPSRCYYSGRVEVCLSRNWSTVCIDNWSSIEAGVACTQLGHSHNGSAVDYYHNYYYWLTSQPPVHLYCNGSELRLIDCQHSNQTCSYPYYDAGVNCPQVVTGCPRNAEITVQSPTTLNISWSPPPTSEIYGTIWWYRVICSGSGTSHSNHTLTANTSTANTLTLAMVGLRPYTYYTCCISTITSVDEGTTVCNSAVTSEAAPTLPPQSVRGNTGSTSLTLYWSPPPSRYRNGWIRHYQIRVIDATTNLLISSDTTQSTSWRVSSLHPHTSYQCTVAAVTVAPGPTETITLQTKQSAPTAAPLGVTGTATSSTSLSLSWSPPPSQYQNGRVRRYQINVTDLITNTLRQFATTSTRLTVSSLRPYSTYQCTVAAVTVAQGPSSTIIMVQTYQDVPSGPPLNLVAVSTSSHSAFLSWDPPSTLQRNGIITGYLVHIVAESGRQSNYSVETTHYNINAVPYTMYNVWVAAKTVNGTGPFGENATVRTLEDVPTVAPTVNSTVRRNATTILITLQPLTQRESRGIIRLYNITYKGFEPQNLTCSRSGSTLSTTLATTYIDGLNYVQLLVDQLDPRLSYCLEVAAATSVGVGPSSEPIAVGLYSNDPFQVHLSGVVHCDYWLAYRPSFKWDEISQAIAEAIQRQCYCPFTSEYIADGRLMCSESDSVVFQGRIISTNSPPNRELLEYLQEWVQSTPTVIIEGVHLHVSNCSVHLNEHELGSTEANCNEPAGQSAVRISIAITMSALVVIIVVTSTVICSVYCWKKRTTTEDKRDNSPSKGDTDDVDGLIICNEYSTQHSISKGRKSKSTVKQEAVELTCRKLSGAAVAQDTSLPHPHEEDKHLPILPPRLYLEDEDFTSQLHNNTMQNTATNHQENAIYQPLLPNRMVTNESSESSVYQPLTSGGTANHKEEKGKGMQSATRNENSKCLPTLPPRLYLEDENFISQLHNSTTQNTAQGKAVCFQVRGNVVQTHEVPSPIADENAIYQPLLPSRMVTEESSESSVYQPLTIEGTNEKSMQSATEIENSTYQPLTFKSATANREQNEEERGQWTMPKESSETSHYQTLVFPKGKPKLHATHVMMAFYDK